MHLNIVYIRYIAKSMYLRIKTKTRRIGSRSEDYAGGKVS
jgi:hypothetical protein